MILGVHLRLLMGIGTAVPVSYEIAEAVSSVSVTHSETGRSAFSITLEVGRGSVFQMDDYTLMRNPVLAPMSRVILVVIFNATPRVLSDGFITQRSLQPSEEPGRSTFTITGEDVSLKLDLVQVKAAYPSMNEQERVAAILARYSALWGLPPAVVPTSSSDTPSPTERIPAQAATDLDYVRTLAARFNYVFHVTPGPLPGQNAAYWGPLVRAGIPQRALSVNMGPFSNVESLSFQHDALAATVVADVTRGPRGRTVPIASAPISEQPLALVPVVPFRSELWGVESLTGENDVARIEDLVTQLLRAQSRVNRSAQNAVTATGQLDAMEYGDILEPRKLVNVRGAGFTHDGTYYVSSVTHTITRGSYKQSFQLARGGTGALAPVVRV